MTNDICLNFMTNKMKNIIKLEEAAMFGLSIFLLSSLNAEWWWYLILFLGPDVSMLGYLAGNKVGAACYNLFHHKGVAVAVFIAGLLLPHMSFANHRHRFIWSFIHGQNVWLWIKDRTGI